jgi:hypothetical protein
LYAAIEEVPWIACFVPHAKVFGHSFEKFSKLNLLGRLPTFSIYIYPYRTPVMNPKLNPPAPGNSLVKITRSFFHHPLTSSISTFPSPVYTKKEATQHVRTNGVLTCEDTKKPTR